MTGDLREVRTLVGGLILELHGNPPTVVLIQGSDRVRVDLANVKTAIVAMGDAR